MIIDILDSTGRMSKEQIDFIEQLLRFIAMQENVTNNAEVSLSFVDDEKIRSLNLQYRGKDEPTDVISFALQEETEKISSFPIDETMPLLLGDIVISLERAMLQAKEYNHSLARELGFLTVHGFLHLLGYDHITKEDEQVMLTRQKELLEAFGLERS